MSIRDQVKLERLEALVYLLLMSDEIQDLNGKHATPLFDIVGGKYTDAEAKRILEEYCDD